MLVHWSCQMKTTHAMYYKQECLCPRSMNPSLHIILLTAIVIVIAQLVFFNICDLFLVILVSHTS